MRPDRDTYFMSIAKLVSTRSTCLRANVGAVLVYNNRVVSMGYNGSVPGAPHCIDQGCLVDNGHCIRTLHGEVNAISNLEHKYEDLILYCTHQPCLNCTKLLIANGVVKVFYETPYPDSGRELFLNDYCKIRFPMVKWTSETK